MIEFRTCRHCNVSTDDRDLLKYSVRHYIHPRCALEKWGPEIINRFPLWQLENFPYKPLVDFGLLEIVRDYCKAVKSYPATAEVVAHVDDSPIARLRHLQSRIPEEGA